MDHDEFEAAHEDSSATEWVWNERPHGEDVMGDYLAADSPADWLVNEVCAYLFDGVPADELEARLHGFDTVMQEERDRLYSALPTADEVVLTLITVEHDDVDEFVSLRGCPSAALLLEICSNMTDPGSTVNVELTYGDGTRSTTSMRWPFSMAQAIQSTTPGRTQLDESLAALDPDAWTRNPPLELIIAEGTLVDDEKEDPRPLLVMLGVAFVTGVVTAATVVRKLRRR